MISSVPGTLATVMNLARCSEKGNTTGRPCPHKSRHALLIETGAGPDSGLSLLTVTAHPETFDCGGWSHLAREWAFRVADDSPEEGEFLFEGMGTNMFFGGPGIEKCDYTSQDNTYLDALTVMFDTSFVQGSGIPPVARYLVGVNGKIIVTEVASEDAIRSFSKHAMYNWFQVTSVVPPSSGHTARLRSAL